MTEPTITCPNCKTEIKLTESLAAPLIAETRRKFEHAWPRRTSTSLIARPRSTPRGCRHGEGDHR